MNEQQKIKMIMRPPSPAQLYRIAEICKAAGKPVVKFRNSYEAWVFIGTFMSDPAAFKHVKFYNTKGERQTKSYANALQQHAMETAVELFDQLYCNSEQEVSYG